MGTKIQPTESAQNGERKKARRWSQGSLVLLIQAFGQGGIKAARRALPHHTIAEIDAKLREHGLLNLSPEDDEKIEDLVSWVKDHPHMEIVRQRILNEMRGCKGYKQEDDFRQDYIPGSAGAA